ncbi:hypothetical protein N7493_008114 [Penicillium malachiteum]|uniref:Uncharacterized protein n=1 Tax=Penicillium malachiteum TaxID=1324776 RepID=A0AAD6MTG1_9EURO|nr:hypothetical protein N7493_008114 [Penicillium malachiteum]
MASLGSMILIFMLAFDPFVQQILSYPSESIMLANNSLAAAAPQLRYFGTGVSDTDWTSAYYLGIWSTDFNITPSCPSGNCTWPNYRSLGICSHCSDMTSSAKFHCPMPSYNDTRDDDGYFVAEGKCEVILPQGRSSNTTVAVEALYVNESFVGEILFTTHKVWEVSPLHSAESVGWNESFSNIKNPLLVLGQISLGFDSGRIKNASNPTEGVIFKNATQCAFSYCIQEYNVSVTNGKVAIEKSSPDLGKTYEYTSIYNTTETCWRPSHSPSDTVLKYTMLGDDALYLNATEFVFCGNRGIESLPFIGSTTMSWSMDSGSSTWTSGLASGGLVPVASSNENFDRISELGLGVVAPRVAESLTKTNLQGSNITNIPGMVYTNELIVRVQWPWMILPTLLVVLGIMFFAYTMYASRQKIFWKSSMLALLFHGLDDETNVNRDECTTVSMMEKLAEGMHVQLQASQSDGRVMLRGT